MKKIDFFILTIILSIALSFRLYKINTPLADLHSWRQADTAAVARNFMRNGFDLLHPKYDDLSSNQSGKENPLGLRFVEFPIYNASVALIYKYFPLLSLEATGRLTTAFFSLIIIGIIYYLTLKESNRIAAIISSSVYAIFPFFVFFSRVVLPETTALAFAFLSIFFLYLYSHQKKSIFSIICFIFSVISFALGLLVKPTVIFYSIALLFLFYRKYELNLVKKPLFYLYFFIAGLPFLLWRLYIQNFPEGIPPSDWLITSVNTYKGLENIFFRPAFFRWIFFERINNFIFGGYLTLFFIYGILKKPASYFLHFILISAVAYLFIFQGGNVQHEYYQTIILPALAIFVGLGASYLFTNTKTSIHPIFAHATLILVFVFSFFFSYYKVRDYYNYPSELPQIAKIVNTLTKESDKIVTDRMGDTTLLYLIDRKGAPSIYKDPSELKKLGYNYLVTLNDGEIKQLKNDKYQIVFENDKFTLFAL